MVGESGAGVPSSRGRVVREGYRGWFVAFTRRSKIFIRNHAGLFRYVFRQRTWAGTGSRAVEESIVEQFEQNLIAERKFADILAGNGNAQYGFDGIVSDHLSVFYGSRTAGNCSKK